MLIIITIIMITTIMTTIMTNMTVVETLTMKQSSPTEAAADIAQQVGTHTMWGRTADLRDAGM
jgi:hypothetical protein